MRNLAGAAIATIQDYPSIAAGSCAFAVAFALVTGNAMLGQPGGHPEPLWATRDKVTTQSVQGAAPDVPVRRVRTETVVPTVIPVPEERPADLTGSARPGDGQQSAVIRQAQEVLAGLGLYKGEVDGIYGPVTREAIVQFQRANGLKPNGEASDELVAMARSLVAPPEAERVAAISPEPARGRERAIEDRIEERLGARGPRVREREPAPEARAEPAASDSVEDIARAARIARIQIGLMNFGEAGISVDGVLGPDTVEAIRLFQKHYGMPATGEPDEAVIRKLEQIGALQNS